MPMDSDSSSSSDDDDGPPPLLGRGAFDADSSSSDINDNSSNSDDDDDGSIPALVGRRGYGGGADRSSSSSDDDDEIPPLVNRNRGGGTANSSNHHRNNNNSNGNNNRGVRGGRGNNNRGGGGGNNNSSSSNNSNNHRGGGGNSNRNRNTNNNNDNNNSRNNNRRHNRAASASSSSSSSDGSLPALIPRVADGSRSSSSSSTTDDDDVPPLAPRRAGGSDSSGSGGIYDSSSSSGSDGSIPELIGRDHGNYDSSDDDDDDDDDDGERERLRAARERQQQQQQRQQQQQQQRQRANNNNNNRSRARHRNQASSSSNNDDGGLPLNPQMVRVDYWARWMEEARAMRAADLQAQVQKLLDGNSNSKHRHSNNGSNNRNHWSGAEKADLALAYAAAQGRRIGRRGPGCVLRLPPPQRAAWERLQRQLLEGDNDNDNNRIGVTLGGDDPPRTAAELRDLCVALRLQAERDRTTSAWERQVRRLQREMSAFRLRQRLRDEHRLDDRTMAFLDTHADLARAAVHARHRRQHPDAALDDDDDNNNNSMDAPVPEAIPAKDPNGGGAWVLAPLFGGGGGDTNSSNSNSNRNDQTYELTYAWADGAAIHKSKVYTTLNGASDVMLPAGAGSVWVYYQTKTGDGGGDDNDTSSNNNDKYAVDQFRCDISDLRIPMYQNLPKATQLVTNGANGLWMLVPEATASSNNSSRRSNRSSNAKNSSSKLILYDGDHRDGWVAEQRVPSRKGVRLFQDVESGGVWVYVPQSKERQKPQANKPMITAGLWHISITGEAVRATFGGSSAGDNDDDDDKEETQVLLLDSCLLASDSARAGVLVLGPSSSDKGKGSVLYHVAWNAEGAAVATRHQRVDAKFENVQSILDDGAGGALLHYRKFKDMGWKLTRAVLGEFELVEKYKCPKNARIVSTGQGAVWVLKKTGRGLNWGLQYLHETKSVEESTEKYAVNSILCGAYERA